MHRITELSSEYPYREDHISSYPWVMQKKDDLKRIHIIGLGDVGLNAALGLRITGAECVSKIGIYDIDQKLCSRLEIEINQILSPLGQRSYPPVIILEEEELFDCDIFLFCATKSVPPVGAEACGDVRMAQFTENRKILAYYASRAAETGFKGLFGVVSDPLDLLCHAAAEYLHPDQIQGFGLGVMFARASYYAAKQAPSDPHFACFPVNGRVYGPHGSGLVAVNSILPGQYEDAATEKLTNLTVSANLSVRALGYKPFIAPGVSSVALTIPEVIAGNWNDSARYLNGVFFGARNRLTSSGTTWEDPFLPDDLFRRLQKSCHDLDRNAHTL